MPNLQVYIPDVPYVGVGSDELVRESWVSPSSNFELWVIAANYDIYDAYLPMAVPEDESGSISLTPFGSISFVIYTTSNASDFSIGVPSSGLKPLAPHGIYPTLYAEHFIGNIYIGPETVYDMLDGGSANGKIVKFDVSISGFSKVHFDAYGYYLKNNPGPQFTKAPFSHDATSTPEPATMSLLGMGLLGFLGFRKKLRS